MPVESGKKLSVKHGRIFQETVIFINNAVKALHHLWVFFSRISIKFRTGKLSESYFNNSF